MLFQFGKGLADLAGIEIPYPHVRQPHVRGCQHQVGQDYGGVCLGRVYSITLTHPGLLVTAAHDQDYRGIVARMDRTQAGQGLLALDNPDSGRLTVAGGRSQAACLKNHVQLGVRDRIAAERVAGITALQNAHESVGTVVVLCDLLVDIREGGPIHDLADIAHAAEKTLFHLLFILYTYQ